MVTGQKAQLFYQNTAMFYYIFMIQKLLNYWMSSRYSFLFVFSFLLAIGRKIINCISWLHLIWFICFINYLNYTPLSVPIAFDDVMNIHKIKSDLYLWNYPAVLARRNCYSEIRTWKKRDCCYLQTRRLFSNY